MKRDMDLVILLLVVFTVIGATYFFSNQATERAKADCEKLGGNLIVTRNGDVCLQKGVVLK